MELELKKSCFDTYEIGGDVTLTHEETAETIVPDYCPDIARIIETDGTVCIHSREIREGRGEVSGTVRVTVLYIPDGEGGIRTLEFAIPFTAETEGRLLADCVHLIASVEAEGLETRMLNPRKVFTHCKLVLRVTGYRRVQLVVSPDVETTPELCVEKRQERQKAALLTNIAEKDFTFSESMNLSPGREGAADILSSHVTNCVTETKIVGGKLIFKGMFTVCLLYRTHEGKCCSTVSELPFSQIMETDGAAEGSSARLQLQMTGSDIQVDGDDPEGRQFAVTLYLHATALLRQERELTILSDLYSTNYELSYEAAPLALTSFCESLSRRQTVREVLEIGVVAESILSVQAKCGTVSVAMESSGASLRTQVAIRALYLDEAGVPLMTERSVEVSCQMELPPERRLTAKAACPGEIQGTLADRGIEVRFAVDFQVEAAAQVKKLCITAAKLDTAAVRDTSGAPSLVLRCLGKQESPWELAKRYNTTIPTILAANQLEREEDIPREKLLLIPRKRA